MFSSFWLLALRSRDLSHAEKEKNAGKAEQIQNDNLGPFLVKIVVIFWICSALQAVISSSGWDKSRDPTAKSLETCRPPKMALKIDQGVQWQGFLIYKVSAILQKVSWIHFVNVTIIKSLIFIKISNEHARKLDLYKVYLLLN